MWSVIILRLVWQGARDAAAVERARRMVSSRISRFVQARWGVVVKHTLLEGDNIRLMAIDVIHLNDTGKDIFLAGLQDGIEQVLALLGGIQGLLRDVLCYWLGRAGRSTCPLRVRELT